MCSVRIQLFLETHTMAWFVPDLHLPVCQLRHLGFLEQNAPKPPFTDRKVMSSHVSDVSNTLRESKLFLPSAECNGLWNK